MRPILFHCGPVKVPSYAAMLYLGIVLGIYAEMFFSSFAGLYPGRVALATIVLLVPALAGARLLFVATHWQQVRNRRHILRAADGGAAMYGGLLLAIPVSIPLLSVLALPFAPFWDVACFPILIGMFVARIGCLLSGCCAGRRNPAWFAMYLPDSRGVWEHRIPSQLLEGGVVLLILTIAIVVWRQHPMPGSLFFLVITLYGAARVLLESTRQQQVSVRGVSLNRVLSSFCVLAGILGYAAIMFRSSL